MSHDVMFFMVWPARSKAQRSHWEVLIDEIVYLDEQHSEYWKLLHFLLVYALYNIYIMVLKAPEDLSGQVSLIMSFPFMRGRRERQDNYCY